jgi:dihydroorotate dehydrogenase
MNEPGTKGGGSSSIKDLLRELVKTDEEIYSKVCKVTAVNGLSCECEPIDGDTAITEVRLIADESTEFFVLVPAVGSIVMVNFLSNTDAYVSMVSKVTEVKYKIGNVYYSANSSGFLLQKDSDTLKQILTLMVEACEKILVLQGNNPDYVKLTQAKIKINNLLR